MVRQPHDSWPHFICPAHPPPNKMAQGPWPPAASPDPKVEHGVVMFGHVEEAKYGQHPVQEELPPVGPDGAHPRAANQQSAPGAQAHAAACVIGTLA